MGFLSGLFRSRDAPKDSTTGSAYRFFMGGTTSGKSVNERSAMQMTAVYSCVRILSEAVAGLPLHLYKYTEKGSKEKAIDHPLYFVLHDEPNPEMTSFVFRETLMTHLLLWGNAYLAKLEKSYSGKQNAGSEFQIEDLEIFENVAYIMAYHADNTIPATIEEWLDQFDMFSIYEVPPQILELWGDNLMTDVTAKKALAEVSGK